MLRIRPYKPCDAEIIEKWIQDEDIYRKWGGQMFGDFPITAKIIDDKYRLNNGDCTEPDNFYSWKPKTIVCTNSNLTAPILMERIAESGNSVEAFLNASLG